MDRAYSHKASWQLASRLVSEQLTQPGYRADDVNWPSGGKTDRKRDSNLPDSDQERYSEIVFHVSLIPLAGFLY